MALTAAQLNQIFENVLFRPAEPAAIAFYANRTDVSDAQIRQQIELSQEAVVFTNPVIRLFEAAFNRLPTQADLRFYGQELKAGFTTEQVATQLASSAEFAARVPGGVVTAAFVQGLYQDLLNRAASPAEVTFYTARSAAQVLNGLANSPEATQAQASAVITFLDSAALGTPTTGDLDVQTGPSNNTNFALTAGVDTVTGTAGTDTIIGVIDDTTPANNTFGIADTINAASGTDNFNIIASVSAANFAVPLSGVSNVENFFVRNLTSKVASFDAATVTGEQQVWNDRSTSGAVTVTGLGTGAVIGVRGDNASTITATNFSYANATDAVAIAIDGGTKGTANISRTQSGEAAVTINSTGASNTVGVIDLDTAAAIKAVMINATTGLKASLAAADFAANSTLTVNGAGLVDLTNAALSANITTVNAGASTGGARVDISGAANVAFTGGAGNDRAAVGTELTNLDTLVGGNGTDTVSITTTDLTVAGGAAARTALNTKVTGFEVLEFTGATATIRGGTDANSFTNAEITKLLFNTVGNDVIDNAGSARLYAAGELNTGDLNINLLASATSVNVSLEGVSASTSDAGVAVVANGGDIGALVVALNAAAAAGATSTVNISSSVTSLQTSGATVENTIGTLTATLGSTYKVTGAADLSVSALTNAGTIDATAFTAKFGLVSAAAGNTVVNLGSGGTFGAAGVTTGAGLDTVTVQGGTNVILTGAANDTVTLTAGTNTVTAGVGADSVTVGSGTDRLVYAAADSTAATPATTLDTVTNFAAGVDKFVGTGVTAIVQGAAYTAAGTGTLATDIGSALAAGGQGAGGVNLAAATAAVVTITGTGAGTYLVANDAAVGYTGATDTAIKLVGLTGTLAVADFVAA